MGEWSGFDAVKSNNMNVISIAKKGGGGAAHTKGVYD